MVQLILEQLVNNTPLVAISPNIAPQDAFAIPGAKVIVQELPSINSICSCWTILRIIGNTVAAYCIGKVEQWDQLLSDGRDMIQIDIHNLVIGAMKEERLQTLIISTSIIMHPLIISTSIILEGDMSEQQVDAVL